MGLNCNSCACIEPTEYCELEQFRPRCPDDKVIIITEARYGLVSLGRCLQADFGYVGCFADVVDYVSAKCSGRRACEQQVPDRYMKEAAARCRQEFNGFLYAAYKCIDGIYMHALSFVSVELTWHAYKMKQLPWLERRKKLRERYVGQEKNKDTFSLVKTLKTRFRTAITVNPRLSYWAVSD